MQDCDAMNGLQHSMAEIDERLRELAPQYNRNLHREVVRNQVDELLDQRNLVRDMMAELVINQFEGEFNG